jgi:hypothetical protein
MSLAELLVTPIGWMLRGTRSDPRRGVRFAEALQGPGILSVSSPSFPDGGPIPRRHAARPRGSNTSPELRWSGVPDGTRRLLLVIEDPDVPFARPLIHTIALLDPGEGADGGVAEGALTPGNLAVHYVPAFRGAVAYQGPRPLPGHGLHHYGFHLHALDTVPESRGLSGIDDLLPLVDGHVLAVGMLTGTQRG